MLSFEPIFRTEGWSYTGLNYWGSNKSGRKAVFYIHRICLIALLKIRGKHTKFINLTFWFLLKFSFVMLNWGVLTYFYCLVNYCSVLCLFNEKIWNLHSIAAGKIIYMDFIENSVNIRLNFVLICSFMPDHIMSFWNLSYMLSFEPIFRTEGWSYTRLNYWGSNKSGGESGFLHS